MHKKGIDVSEHNGVINWEKVKESGVEFAMLRGGYGQTVDKQFTRNATECNRLGIPIGVYWFSYALTVEAAKKEAAFCVDAIKDYEIEYPVAFDFEYDSVNYATKKGVTITKELASSMAMEFCNYIKKSFYVPMNYTNRDFLARYFDESVKNSFMFWLAQWPYNPNPDSPPMSCDIWQYSSNGAVPGISGAVDLDACYYSTCEKTSTSTVDTEKTEKTDFQIVQERAGLADSTMAFLTAYKYGDDLIRKLAAAIRG